MGLLNRFWEDLRQWDKPSQLALLVAALMGLLCAGLVTFGPPEWRNPAAIALVGVIVVAQVIVMWGNRHLIAPITQAQRLMLVGDLEAARAVLLSYLDERQAQGRAPSVRALALLGNVQRQLGALEESERLLRDALRRQPTSHLAAYGLGRTLLALGEYQEAESFIKKSLALGAPPVVQFDLGHALIRQGRNAEAIPLLRATQTAPEAHRRLLAAYWLYRLGNGPAPSAELVREGSAFWHAETQRCAHTPYGRALLEDIHGIQTFAE
ncbi:MAG: tetratricopeptide repeat protein [Anaerolineae bacterium]|nr:tetratricopeptide repeat protein [Anaerolineae bacterium]MDW8173086.1 tetratricopeptide repeat protein [Anaerolineae bacterium]